MGSMLEKCCHAMTIIRVDPFNRLLFILFGALAFFISCP